VGPKTKGLIVVLSELAVVLEVDGDTHWSGWKRNARTRLLNSDYSGIEHLLSAYGGLGSLNDLVVGQCYKDGILACPPGHVKLNEKFSALRNKAWDLANEIRQSQF
jgi:hypothetical protein